MLTVMNTIINSVMNTVMSMCPVTNSVLKPVMNRESHLLTTSGLVDLVTVQLSFIYSYVLVYSLHKQESFISVNISIGQSPNILSHIKLTL